MCAGILPIEVIGMHVWESVELQFLSERLHFRDIFTLKFLFHITLFRLSNKMPIVCFFIASLQNLCLCVMILILRLTYVIRISRDILCARVVSGAL